MRTLSSSARLERLQSLEWDDYSKSAATVAPLLAGARLPAIKHLQLSLADWNAAAIQAIEDAPWADQLESLDFRDQRVDETGVKAFAKATKLNLQEFVVWSNPKASDAKALAQCSALENVRRLVIDANSAKPSVLKLLEPRFRDRLFVREPPQLGGHVYRLVDHLEVQEAQKAGLAP
jgi:hypothetical protein